MCLVTRQRKPRVLKKDLKVYKVLKNGDNSAYECFKWGKGILYKQNFSIQRGHGKKFCMADDKSFLAYVRLNNCTEISKGFHACLTEERAKVISPRIIGFDTYAAHEFLIPAGSEVYYDCTDLVVANQMMML